MRWTLSAADVMFQRPLYNHLSALGRGVPTERGVGVYQRAMDFAVERMNCGHWVHVFPEGGHNHSLTDANQKQTQQTIRIWKEDNLQKSAGKK